MVWALFYCYDFNMYRYFNPNPIKDKQTGDYNGMRYFGNYSGRRGYTRDGEMISNLRELMEDAPDEQTRSDLQRMISRMEMM